ncbi:MAG TPA: hypothetical protein VIM75_06355 [Ohtaekwangia sp.]|uniref:hypothetical protein n=1 Tax=Ohtaekwangia sp. TaxID=2066019 RepID=UPI002F945FEB
MEHIVDEFVFTHRDQQEVYFDVNVSKLLDRHEVQGLVLKLYNITPQKLREQELIRSNQQLDRVIIKQRMISKPRSCRHWDW